ncbi:MAG: glutathione synthase [Gammaproteobacteria bacterium]|nr:glutathione synthase [Gammaproteobacteria bacterium]MDH5630687.1 glutathione synthase [Gammaproteobacteria bacterium]
MSLKIAILMDPIENINTKKDSSFAMLLEAQARGHQLFYFKQGDLFLRDNQVQAHYQPLTVKDDPSDYYSLSEIQTAPLTHFDCVLMRKDPPFNMEFVYSTYLLQLAVEQGVLVVNNPQSIRDANEKLYTAWFPQCCVDTLVSRNAKDFRDFLAKHQDIILKPLDGMGGSSIFRVQASDPNIGVIIETLTQLGQQTAMAQQFIPEIVHGDKRILMVNGEPVPYSLARIPAKGETRGNLAAGGKGVAMPLTERELWIAHQVGPTLREKGLMFVGLDVIGDYLTEINVTSPTCIREIDAAYQINIAGMLFDAIEAKINH